MLHYYYLYYNDIHYHQLTQFHPYRHGSPAKRIILLIFTVMYFISLITSGWTGVIIMYVVPLNIFDKWK